MHWMFDVSRQNSGGKGALSPHKRTGFQAVWQALTRGDHVIYFSDKSSGRNSINLLPNPYRAGTGFCVLRWGRIMQKNMIVC
jgi:hypothetical protein